MTKKDFEAALGKLISDKEFRKAIEKDPEKALKKYKLTRKEIEALSLLKDKKVKGALQVLDRRISKFPIHGGGGRRKY